MFLHNKRILLGITGGIAAYKTPDLVRKLKAEGAEVRVVLSRGAEQFVAPLSLQAVSGQPTHSAEMSAESESGMGHIDLARWADIVLIAPATAHFLASLRQGQAYDLLTTVCTATSAPIAVAPAMNQQMWANATTQENLIALKASHTIILGPDSGDQACGENGMGRMLQPEMLVELLAQNMTPDLLEGQVVCITAGPTWEAIDPVRGITNHSSGKMGYALARAARAAGAEVVLVTGPTCLEPPPSIATVKVQSAAQMRDAVFDQISQASIFIGVAAVADYRPVAPHAQKIKKSSNEMTIELVKNPDILKEVAALPSDQRPFCVGFAAETESLIDNAQKKLKDKHLDLIVANSVGGAQTTFGSDRNEVTLISSSESVQFDQESKALIAQKIIRHIAAMVKSGESE